MGTPPDKAQKLRFPFRIGLTAATLIGILTATPEVRAASYLEVPVVPSSYGVTPSGFTFECWIKVLAQPGQDPRIVRCRNTQEGPCGNASTAVWELFVCRLSACSTGRPYFGLQSGGVCNELAGGASIINGAYHHLAATYEGAKMRFYIDGAPAESLALSGFSVNVTGGKIVIGNSTDYINSIECEVDDIRLWSVARTRSEIQAGMGGEISPTAGLVANWKLNGDGSDAVGGPSLIANGEVTFVSGKYGSAAFIDNTPPIPDAPVASASDTSDAGVTVTWTDVAQESGYRVYRGSSLRATLGINVTSFFDFPPPGTYNYCVEAFNGTGTSARGCDSGTRLVPPPPDTPTTCAASENQVDVTVTWSDVGTEESYRVYRDGTLVATPSANVLTFTDTPSPGFYTYCVEAFNPGGASGQRCDTGAAIPFAGHTYEVIYDPISTWHASDQAAGVSGKYLATILTAGEEAYIKGLIAQSNPPIPGAFWIGYSKVSATFRWSTLEVSPYTNWAPNEPNNSGGNEAYASILFSTDASRNGFWNDAPDEGFGPGTGDIGRLGYIVETGPFASVPSIPASFTASDNGFFVVALSWSDVGGEDGYYIYRDGVLITTTGANSTSSTDGPAPGTYTYCVQAFNVVGSSGSRCDSGRRLQPVAAPMGGPLAIALTVAALGLVGSRSLKTRGRQAIEEERRSREDRR